MADTFWKFSDAFCKAEKIQTLANVLNIPLYAAGALTSLLYAWGSKKAENNGSINDYTTKAIETSCLWDGHPGDLVRAFHSAGLVTGDFEGRADDNPLQISEWETVAIDLLKKRADSRARKQKQRNCGCVVTREGTRDGTRDVTPPKNTEVQNYRAAESVEYATAAAVGDDRPDFNTVEVYAANNLTAMSGKNMEDFVAFKDIMSEDLMRHAIDEACAQGKRTWAYVRAILMRYEQDGIKTVGDAKAAAKPNRDNAQGIQPPQQKRVVNWG